MCILDIVYLVVAGLSYVFYVLWFIKPFFGFTLTEKLEIYDNDDHDNMVRIFMLLTLGLVVAMMFPFFLIISPILGLIYLLTYFINKKHKNDKSNL